MKKVSHIVFWKVESKDKKMFTKGHCEILDVLDGFSERVINDIVDNLKSKYPQYDFERPFITNIIKL